MSWDHFLLRITRVFNGVGGTIVLNMLGIWSVVPMMFICRAYYLGLGAVLWCMHNTWMSGLSIMGSIRNYGGIVGSSYVMVSTLKCMMMCESEKGPL